MIYNETKQTNRLTRTSKKCIRILHVGEGGATHGVKSGTGTGGGESVFGLFLFLFGQVCRQGGGQECGVRYLSGEAFLASEKGPEGRIYIHA